MRTVTKIIYRQTRKIFLVGMLFVSCAGNAQSGRELDSILASLKNNELYVAPVIRGVWLLPVTPAMKEENAEGKKPLFVVSSINKDVRDLATVYTKKVLSQKLYVLLTDPEKDFYVNALLYDLLDNRDLAKLFAMTRDKWISSGKQKCDMEFWDNYFNAKPVSHY